MEIYGCAKDFTGDSFLTTTGRARFRVAGLRDVSSLVTAASNERFELAEPFFSRTHLIDWAPLYHCSFLDLWPLVRPVLGTWDIESLRTGTGSVDRLPVFLLVKLTLSALSFDRRSRARTFVLTNSTGADGGESIFAEKCSRGEGTFSGETNESYNIDAREHYVLDRMED